MSRVTNQVKPSIRRRSRDDISALVKAVAPKPVNVIASINFTTVAELADMGVRRISVGSALARAAWAGFIAAATEIAERGTFTAFDRNVAVPEINRLIGASGRHGR